MPRRTIVSLRVIRGMVGLRHNGEIGDVIVVGVMVDVMNNESLRDRSVIEPPHVLMHRAAVSPTRLVPVSPAAMFAVIVAVE